MNPSKSLTARAAFLQKWDWTLVVALNQSVCAEGSAQHGMNSETFVATADAWNTRQPETMSLQELVAFLQDCQQSMPFLFLNDRTFAELGRQIALAHFTEVPKERRREIAAALVDHITGLIERDMLEIIIGSLRDGVTFKPGDRVTTLRGTLSGTVVEPYPDGRTLWRPDGSDLELISPPGGLMAK